MDNRPNFFRPPTTFRGRILTRSGDRLHVASLIFPLPVVVGFLQPCR
jgi:hypothetical protein